MSYSHSKILGFVKEIDSSGPRSFGELQVAMQIWLRSTLYTSHPENGTEMASRNSSHKDANLLQRPTASSWGTSKHFAKKHNRNGLKTMQETIQRQWAHLQGGDWGPYEAQLVTALLSWFTLSLRSRFKSTLPCYMTKGGRLCQAKFKFKPRQRSQLQLRHSKVTRPLWKPYRKDFCLPMWGQMDGCGTPTHCLQTVGVPCCFYR